MGVIVSMFFVLFLIWFAQCQVTLESCRMECGHVLGVQTTNGGNRPAGLPGKKGPVGPKGQKGEIGTSCNCTSENAFREQQEELNNLRRLVKPRSCEEVSTRKPNWSRGGVYTIFPYQYSNVGVQVYCDVVTDGGGWIVDIDCYWRMLELVLLTFQVFQKRVNGTEDFFRGWHDYVSGFGKLDEEFWLGLDTIHNLTKNDEYEMRVDLEDFDGNKSYASYSTFVVSGPPFYSLRVGGYQGTAGHAMISGNFSTKDRDQDTWSSNCAQAYKGGWWYTACHAANLNGLYLRGTHTSYANGVIWRPWKGYHYSLKIAEMKLRRK